MSDVRVPQAIKNAEAYAAYADEAVKLHKLVFYTIYDLTGRGLIAARHAIESGEEDIESARLAQCIKMQAELCLCRAVSNFISYLAALMELILLEKPQLLSSKSDSIDFAKLFAHKDIDQLHLTIALEKIENLTRRGFAAINGFFKTNLKFDIFILGGEEEVVVKRIIDIRNLIIHNRSKADKYYVDSYPEESLSIGQELPLLTKDLCNFVAVFDLIVVRLHKDAASKWNLPMLPMIENDDFLVKDSQGYLEWLKSYFNHS